MSFSLSRLWPLSAFSETFVLCKVQTGFGSKKLEYVFVDALITRLDDDDKDSRIRA